MNEKELIISKNSACMFQECTNTNKSYDNLFVITHLGQLKQMEALISSKKIENNCLVVLYTFKNLVVPQNVHNQYSNVFSQVIFLKIPFGVNKVHFSMWKGMAKNYEKLISILKPKSLYLCSWEAHYAILATIAKNKKVRLILVEEGTATYKPNLDESFQNVTNIDLSYQHIYIKFMATVGQTQIFKRLVKIHKYNKDLYKQSKKFLIEVSKDEAMQAQLVKLAGGGHMKAALEPFKDFDKAYASSPKLIREGFGIQDVDYFLIHDEVSEESLKQAIQVINKYDIRRDDILFVSQRYNLDPEQYVNAVSVILHRMMDKDQKVFIKLHPKENEKIYNSFKYIEFASKGRFVVIEDSQFLIESVIRISKIKQLVGLTSTTLVYGPLVSPETKAISIADQLMEILSTTPRNLKGFKEIELHLAELKLFDNIEFR